MAKGKKMSLKADMKQDAKMMKAAKGKGGSKKSKKGC